MTPLQPLIGQTVIAEWTAPSAGTISPTGMALATEGGTTYLYVSDHLGGRIIKFDTSTGEVAAILGSPGTGNGQFGEPYGLAIEPVSGDLYVAERGNDRVQRITSSGEFVMAWGGPGTEPGLFNEPIGVAVDASGTVYVTEHSNHRVQQFSVTQSGGTWSTTAIGMWGSQGSGPGQFNIPYGIAIEPAGSILVADGFNGRVQRFSADGSYQATIGAAGTAPGQFVVATGVTTDAAGAIYVTSTNPDPQNGASADAASQWVSKFTAAGGFESRFGGVHGSGPGNSGCRSSSFSAPETARTFPIITTTGFRSSIWGRCPVGVGPAVAAARIRPRRPSPASASARRPSRT